MKQLWIQYTYADTQNASVCQTANSKEEACDDSDLFPGCPWYRYDIIPGPGDGKLAMPNGPHYFRQNNPPVGAEGSRPGKGSISDHQN